MLHEHFGYVMPITFLSLCFMAKFCKECSMNLSRIHDHESFFLSHNPIINSTLLLSLNCSRKLLFCNSDYLKSKILFLRHLFINIFVMLMLYIFIFLMQHWTQERDFSGKRIGTSLSLSLSGPLCFCSVVEGLQGRMHNFVG